ncbi:MAG: hypothetical protein HQ512_00770 [Rhodospirillales bacterium]|nr:hypothetical protein [Rhodospirillales bacterium]
MEMDVKVLKVDDLGRNHIVAEPATVEDLYRHNLIFWTTRFRDELSEEERKTILDNQENIETPYTRPATLKLHEVLAEASEKSEFSMLELGAANGTVMKRIEEKFPKPKLTYVGFECLPLLADDFKKKFPEHKIHLGDVEEFIGKEKSFFPEAPFTLFYATLVFKMIKPDLVRKALRKAAELTNQFLIYDLLEDTDTELGPDETLILHMPARPVFWFVHPWAEYLAEIGFKIVDKQVSKLTEAEAQSPLYDHQVRGAGYFHAIRE